MQMRSHPIPVKRIGHCFQVKVDKTFVDRARWTKMSIMSTAGSGKFSSDRTTREYAEEIWGIQPVERFWYVFLYLAFNCHQRQQHILNVRIPQGIYYDNSLQ